jgi:hypothetical protein
LAVHREVATQVATVELLLPPPVVVVVVVVVAVVVVKSTSLTFVHLQPLERLMMLELTC